MDPQNQNPQLSNTTSNNTQLSQTMPTPALLSSEAVTLPKVYKNQFKGNVAIKNSIILFLLVVVLGVISYGIFALLILLTLRQKVTATVNGLEVTGAFSNKLIPWSDIANFTIAPTPYVYTRSGKKYNIASAFYVTLLSKVKSKAQNDPNNVAILQELNSLVASSSNPAQQQPAQIQ